MAWSVAREAKKRIGVVAAADVAEGGAKFMTPSQIEREFGPSRRTIGRMIAAGKLTPITVNKRVRVARIEVLRAFAGLSL